MERDFDTSNWNKSYDGQQSRSEALELLESDDSETIMADGSGFDSFDRLDEENEKYERFRNKYERLMEKHIETQDELTTEVRGELERVIDEYGDVVEVLEDLDEEYQNLDDEYKQMMENYENAADRLIYTLDDFSDSQWRSGVKDTIQGAVFFGAGILSADQYSFGGAIDFYANAASNYANEPETMILTLGLPFFGVWFVYNALGDWSDSRELDNAADEWRRRKSNIRVKEDSEDTDDDSSSRIDGIDIIRTKD